MKKQTPDEIIEAAKQAHDAAAWRVWERDEFEDRGSCGGFMLALDARSPVAKRLHERKLGTKLSGPGIYVMFPIDGRIRSQNADIPEAAGRAARAIFEAAGVRIVEARSYTD